jgi:hypothetical protein
MHRLEVISFFQTAGSKSASILSHLRIQFNIILLIFKLKTLANITPAIYSGCQKYVSIDAYRVTVKRVGKSWAYRLSEKNMPVRQLFRPGQQSKLFPGQRP